MRLLTHNTMRNNTLEAKGQGYPLKITAVEVQVLENPDGVSDRNVNFVKHILPTIQWKALVQVCCFPAILLIGPPLSSHTTKNTFRPLPRWAFRPCLLC